MPDSANTPARVHGLYVLADSGVVPVADLERRTAEALAGGARVVQYRDKGGEPVVRLRTARALNALSRAHGALFIVNDDVELAANSGAHGVHVGREDAACRAARVLLGPGAIIGVSCYNQFDRARQAQAEGADYVAFGSFYPSVVKPAAVRASVALLAQARAALRVPIVAIGGITVENARALIDAGADALAVISAVYGQPDVRAAAAALARLFNDSGAHAPAERSRT